MLIALCAFSIAASGQIAQSGLQSARLPVKYALLNEAILKNDVGKLSLTLSSKAEIVYYAVANSESVSKNYLSLFRNDPTSSFLRIAKSISSLLKTREGKLELSGILSEVHNVYIDGWGAGLKIRQADTKSDDWQIPETYTGFVFRSGAKSHIVIVVDPQQRNRFVKRIIVAT